MDPNSAYATMNDCLKSRDYSEACEAAIGLRDWVRKGGFLPEMPNRTSASPGALYRQLIAECNQVIDLCWKHTEF